MTHKAKDLSPDQKVAIESLLGRSIAENEEISIHHDLAFRPGVASGLMEERERAGAGSALHGRD